jgi:hypothetical protein
MIPCPTRQNKRVSIKNAIMITEYLLTYSSGTLGSEKYEHSLNINLTDTYRHDNIAEKCDGNNAVGYC